jgi:small nuclear ribonucleoprotein (snRNP)-like protein
MEEEDLCVRDYEVYLDQRITVMLRDETYLYGTMKSFDQFKSIALDATKERIYHGNAYAEREHGLYVIRGENIALIGLGEPNLRKMARKEYDSLKQEIAQAP